MKNSYEEIVNRLTSFIINNNINLYQVVSEFDLEGTGFFSQEDLKYALAKIKFDINSNEMEQLLRHLHIENIDMISVKDFVRTFIRN